MGRPTTIVASRRRYRFRRGAWLVAAALILIVFSVWLRDSSVVAVKHVNIEGVTGNDAARITAALDSAARDMTTLHVRKDELQTAVAPYPSVKSVEAYRKLPNTLTIKVTSRDAVAAIAVGTSRQAVAADGVILRGSSAKGVPVVPMRMPPTGEKVTGARELQALTVLGAAPAALRSKIERLRFTSKGIVLTLIKGPELRFGDASRPNAKWMAIARVLADDSSKGATYIDVHLPGRPAAGGLEDPALQNDPRTQDDATPPPSALGDQQPTQQPTTTPVVPVQSPVQ